MTRLRNSRTGMRRNGFSLVETSIALASGTFLLLLSVKVLHQTLLLSATANTKVAFLHSNSRLSRQFRDDVHESIHALIDEEKTLRLTMGNGDFILYRSSNALGNSILRERRSEGSDNHQQEVFRLLENSSCRFRIAEQPGFVLLEMESSIPSDRENARLELRVLAQTGRMQRLKDQTKVTP